jgi:hypothetical protein
MSAELPKGPDDRRKHVRVDRNFILTYTDKAAPTLKNEITQLRNISRGGMCFVATRAFPVSAVLVIEMRTPFTTGSIMLEGIVLEARERIKGMIYDVRLQFQNLPEQANDILEKIEYYGIKGRGAV